MTGNGNHTTYKNGHDWGDGFLMFIIVLPTLIYIYILLGGLEHEPYDFPYIGNVIIPTD